MSSRVISSKCERSLGPMMSDRPEEWRLEDFEDFEFVRSGGLPGAPPRARLSWVYVRVAMRGRGSFLVEVLFWLSGAPMRREGTRSSAGLAQSLRGDGINEWTYSCSEMM